MTAAVSVIVTTKDRPHFLRHALESIDSQSRKATEIIVVDDGSRMPAESAVDMATATIPIRFVRNDVSKGVSAARNQGAEAAIAEWVLFLDDDDWLGTAFLENMTQALDSAAGMPAFLWSNRVDVYSDRQASKNLGPASLDHSNSNDQALEQLMQVSCSGMLFNAERFVRCGGFNESLCVSEDRDLVFRLLQQGVSARNVPDADLFFRIHDGPRLSNSDKKAVQARDDLSVIDTHRAFLKNHPAIADKFLGRVAKRLWSSGYCAEALRVSRMHWRLQPWSSRTIKRNVLWHVAALFRSGRKLQIRTAVAQ
ncbi:MULTISPECIES: glycosyltransferase family 2 protein [Marinobacter]|uniref:glycosyltransferase family 2 protein n=1 Tax=Marinobacter TaxID=2742 RepID=UPI000DAE2825|nr:MULTISPECIES: glycosyltransferase family A protein [Marinobacter]